MAAEKTVASSEKKRAIAVLGIVAAFVLSCCTGGWFFLVRPMSRFADANAAFGRALHEEVDGAVWTFVPQPKDRTWLLVIGVPEEPADDDVGGIAETAWRLHARERAAGSIVIGGVAVGRANRNVADDETHHGTSSAWQENVISVADLIEATGVPAPPPDAALELIGGATDD